MSYNLSNIPQIDALLNDSLNRKDIATSLNLKLNTWKHKNGVTYNILKYNKEWLAKEAIRTTGLLRSIIFKDNGSIVCIAPPKSLPTDNLIISESLEFVAETFIEGTMINVFYENETNSWEIATRSNIGGESCFFMDKKFKAENTFKYMFEEICKEVNMDLNNLNKKYVYSFVIQHPRNRIVKVIKEMRLYLVEVYQILDNRTINVISIKNELENLGISALVRFPKKIYLKNNDDLEECKKELASMNTPYSTVGVIIKNNLGERYKFRNPNYEHVRQLRGNQPKLQFHYLNLRQHAGKIGEYLKYYKEHSNEFNQYRTLLHDYTNELYNNYIRCYIKKEKELKEFPEKFRTHMYSIHHEIYLQVLRPQQKYVTKNEVINYFNMLPPAKQMFVLNYDMRKQLNDTLQVDGLESNQIQN